MSETEAIARSGGKPSTIVSLLADLGSLGVVPGSVVVVHPSLSSLGWVCGGAIALIEAPRGAVADRGTLVIPTHSADLSEPSRWENPPVPSDWWPLIRSTMPPYDPLVTPTRGMGVTAETFRSLPDVARSNHPTSSFAALGPQASEILAEQALHDAFGEHSPLAHLYELGAQVLLLGVSHASNTSLHLAERKAFGDRQQKLQTGSPLYVNGRREWVQYEEPDIDESDFERLGSAFQAETSSARAGKVGAGSALLMPQRELVDFGVAWLRHHRDADGRPTREG